MLQRCHTVSNLTGLGIKSQTSRTDRNAFNHYLTKRFCKNLPSFQNLISTHQHFYLPESHYIANVHVIIIIIRKHFVEGLEARKHILRLCSVALTSKSGLQKIMEPFKKSAQRLPSTPDHDVSSRPFFQRAQFHDVFVRHVPD